MLAVKGIIQTWKKLTCRERPVASMIRSHVNVKSSRSGNLLQLTGWPRGSSDIIQTAHHLEHRRQGDPASFSAEACVWANAVMDIVLHRSIDAYLIGVREEFSLTIGIDKADEDFVARFDPDRSTAIINRCRHLALPIGAESAVKPDPFHGVMQ